MGFSVEDHSRIVNQRTAKLKSVSIQKESAESKNIKKKGGMFSRLLSTFRVKWFGSGIDSKSVSSESSAYQKPRIKQMSTEQVREAQQFGMPHNSIKLITHKGAVVAVKVNDSLMSLEDARKLPVKSSELKTTLAALDRGANERMKGSRSKIGSKLYVKGNQVGVRTSVFGDKHKVVAGKVSIDDLSMRVTKHLELNNYSVEVNLPKPIILHDLKELKAFQNVNSENIFDTHISAIVKDVEVGLKSLPEDLNDTTFAHFNNVLEKFSLLEDIAKDVDKSPELAESVALLQTTIDAKKELFEKIKTFKTLNEDIQHLVTQHSDSKAVSLVAPLRSDVVKIKNWDDKIANLTTAKTLLKKGISLEEQLTSIKQKATSFGSEVDQKITGFDSTIDSPTTLQAYTDIFSSGLATLTKDIAKAAVQDSATHISSMKESVVNLHSEYQKGVNFGFKTMLFSFKSRFEQRFDYLNKQALSLSNVELSQKKEAVIDPPGLSKDAKETLFNDIKSLYLEKRFGTVYKTHVGSQYSNWQDQVRPDAEIDVDIQTRLSNAGYVDPIKMKSITDYIFTGALDSIKSSFQRDAGNFITMSFAKDAYFSTLRTQGEMVHSLETNIEDFKTVIADTTSQSVIETSPDKLIDDLVDFNQVASKFQEFSTAYLVGKQVDNLITKPGLNLIVEDYLNSHPNIEVPTEELKQVFIDYSFERLKRKGFVTDQGQFNLEKTPADIKKFNFRVDTHNVGAKIHNRNNTLPDRNIYLEHFSKKSKAAHGDAGKTFFKAMVPDGDQAGFDTFLTHKLDEAVKTRGQYAEQQRVLSFLKSQKSSTEEFVSGAKLKTEVWGVQFKQARPIEKLKMLFKLKEDIEATYEEVTADDEQTKLESTAENITGKLDQAAESLARANDKLNELDEKVSEISTKVSAASSQLDDFTKMLGMMENEDSSAVSSISDLSSSMETFLSDVKGTAGSVLDTVSPFIGDAKDLIEDSVDSILTNVPFYNQLEGAAEVLGHLAKAGYSARQLKQFAEITNKVTTLNSFGTASDLENGPTELKESVDSLVKYMKAQGSMNNELLKAAFSLANVLSPPGVKIGKLMSKIHNVFSFETLSDKTLAEISTAVSTINDEFASISFATSADEDTRNTAISDKTLSFLNRLEHADLNQIIDKAVDGSTTELVTTFYNVAQSYQDLSFSGGSADNFSAVMKKRYKSLAKINK